jgi:uncharacterized membrane protein YphA (DoxX/SURF4 family)
MLIASLRSKRFSHPPARSLRGDTPLAASRTSLNIFAAAALVALRFVVGAHFFHEGYSKWRDPKPYSGNFFNAAKGPFAETFKTHVLDPDGLGRLNEENVKATWTDYVAKAKTTLKLDDKQSEAADAILDRRLKEYANGLKVWESDIEEYKEGLERQHVNSFKGWHEYDSFKKHDSRIASELMPKRMSWQAGIDNIAKSLEKDINKLAEGDNDPTYVAVDKPGRFFLDSDMLDQIIPFFHMTMGALLVVGLLTRVSALLAAGFLGSVIAAQWPFTPGTISTSYQQVEFFALLFLAGIGAGQWAGLDALIANCCCGGCSTSAPNSSAQTTSH